MKTTPVEAPPAALPRFRRRDFLRFSALGLGAYAVVKAGWGGLASPTERAATQAEELAHLTARQATVLKAALPLIAGPTAEAAFHAGRWNPLPDVDTMLARLAPDQRGLLGTALHLFEHGHGGWRPFSRLGRGRQLAYLATWRTSSLAVRRSTWGFLHAAGSYSFAGTQAGWALMDYPGPCLPYAGFAGRAPGQSTSFAWDPKVP